MGIWRVKMENKRAFCLFEQSGTFRDAFKEFGYDAKCYDIQNEFGKTDCVCDLWNEFDKALKNEKSIFDDMYEGDVIFAFFPCIRFTQQVTLLTKCASTEMGKWSDEKKMEYSVKIVNEMALFYERLNKLIKIGLNKKLHLIIENPYSVATKSFLTVYAWFKPAVIDMDRNEHGDYYRKPTQYFFFGFEPKNNYVVDPPRKPVKAVGFKHKENSHYYDKHHFGVEIADNKQTNRSMIAPEYAKWFIEKYILDKGEVPQKDVEQTLFSNINIEI